MNHHPVAVFEELLLITGLAVTSPRTYARVSGPSTGAFDAIGGDWIVCLDADDRLLQAGLGLAVTHSRDCERTGFPKSSDLTDSGRPAARRRGQLGHADHAGAAQAISLSDIASCHSPFNLAVAGSRRPRSDDAAGVDRRSLAVAELDCSPIAGRLPDAGLGATARELGRASTWPPA